MHAHLFLLRVYFCIYIHAHTHSNLPSTESEKDRKRVKKQIKSKNKCIAYLHSKLEDENKGISAEHEGEKAEVEGEDYFIEWEAKEGAKVMRYVLFFFGMSQAILHFQDLVAA